MEGDEQARLTAENAALRQEIADLRQELNALRNGVLYEHIFDQMPVPMVVYKMNGEAAAINRQNEQLVGSSRDAIVGHHNIFDDPAAVTMGYVARFQQARRGTTITMPPTLYDTGEAQLSGRVDNRQFWSETTYFPVRNRAGIVEYIGEVNIDVTERVHAEDDQRRLNQQIQERERRFRGLFDHAAIAMALIDAQGRVLESNPALQMLLGYTNGELRGMAPADFTLPDDRDNDRELFRGLIEGRHDNYQIEKRYVHKSGRVVIVLLTVSAIRNTQGQLELVIGMAQDITGRRVAEEALRASEDLLKSLLNQLPSFIFVKDKQQRYLLANMRYAQLFGYQPEDLIGKTDLDLFGSDVANRYAASDKQVLQNCQVVEWEDQITVGSETRVIACTKFPLFASEDNCYAVCAICIDITQRKQDEIDRLNLERKLLETQKLESLGLLAGGIAHDFNNLLVAILGNASFVLEDAALDAHVRRSIEHIEIAARRAADLTKQMLAYAGKGRFVVQPLNLNTLVQEMSHLLHTSVSKHITLQFVLDPQLPAIQGDATQLRQIVMNLVINASEAIGPHSGVVAVMTGVLWVDNAYRVRMGLDPDLPEGRYVFLEVSDTGIGMDEATKAKIFEPFFTTKFTGRGLGLAAVQGIVRGHNGAVQVESTPDSGSIFKILLPAVEQPIPVEHQEVVEAPKWQSSGTVLIVDDENDVRQVMGRILERMGFVVIHAADGAAALQLLKEHARTITLVLLDMTMPQLSGEEVFCQLRLIDPAVPVILMSGYNEQETTSRFAGKGLAGFLHKPFTIAELRDKLKQILGEV
jgi:PAS domain S-box-containing protein